MGDDDRSLGLGLFPEDCLHPCRLYLSRGSNVYDKSKSLRDIDNTFSSDRNFVGECGQNTEKSSYEMLGSTASSGDRIGILVYICGRGEEGQSRFGRDKSNDCLFEDSTTGRRERANSLDDMRKKLAGCTPHHSSRRFVEDDHGDDEYYINEDEDEYDDGEGGDQDMEDLRRCHMEEHDDTDEDTEHGMHVCFNLNGCPLNVPWTAVRKISEFPWGQTAVYPTISFTVPSTSTQSQRSTPENYAASVQKPPTTPNASETQVKSDKTTCQNTSPENTESAVPVPFSTLNTVKIWVSNRISLLL